MARLNVEVGRECKNILLRKILTQNLMDALLSIGRLSMDAILQI